jgi:DNA-binding CsgD family transcriptional regulator
LFGTAKEIAEKLNISARTIEGHKKNLMRKANVKNTAGLVVYVLKNDIITL